MKATYDVEAKALYVYVAEDDAVKVDHTEDLLPGAATVDLTHDDKVVGIEFLNVELDTAP